MPASSIRRFWKRLEGAVHPDDVLVLKSIPHTFNLDFPPPAFIGDVDNAPIVILMGNGGYNSDTPLEFPDRTDHDEYIQWLRGERVEVPRNLAAYYTKHRLFPRVRQGKVVIVNAVAYRSTTTAKEVREVAGGLPSAIAHREWLRHELLPAAAKGTRLVIVHRCGLWNFPAKDAKGCNRSR
jgi:hypothetical protein